MKGKESYTLVTTGLQETWPKTNQKTVFLGKWCLMYVEKKKWSKYNFTIPSYHWDNREVLYNDYRNLNILYEIFLELVSKRLNEIHDKNYDKNFWRIIIGHWLGYFIQIIYDRWTTLNEVLKKYQIENIYVFEKHLKEVIPINFKDFKEKYGTDEWNEQIYKDIICHFKFGININKINSTQSIKYKKNFEKSKSNNLLKNLLKKNLYKHIKIFCLETNMGWLEEIRFQLRMGQIPNINNFPNIDLNINSLDNDKRFSPIKIDNNKNNLPFKNDFLNYLSLAIPKYMPYSYLEGFQENFNFILRNKYLSSINPKYIFTSTGHFENESFKLWIALKQRSKIPIVISQHGGFYGIGKYSFNEEHEKKISNFYLTYGWDEKNNPKVLKNCIIRKSPFKNISPKRDGNCLLVILGVRRYSNFLSSLPIAHQSWENHHAYQEKFVSLLKSSIKSKLIVRCHQPDYGNNHFQRWVDNKNVSNVDFGTQKIRNLIKKSRIFISTYNATTFLESLTANFPTLIYWDKNMWETREEAFEYLEMLNKAGILHYSYKSASAKLNEVWDDMDNWWNNSELQSLKNKFCDQYANNNNSKLLDFFKKMKMKNNEIY